MNLPGSPYVSGYRVPQLSCEKAGSSVYIEKDSYLMSQKIVAKGKIYCLKRQFDTMMIESNERNSEMTGRNLVPVWFGNFMVFIRIVLDRIGQSFFKPHRKRFCSQCSFFVRALCFVQYYEDTYITVSRNDKIDEILDCIQLQWHRSGSEAGQLSSAKQYGFVPVDRIQAFV